MKTVRKIEINKPVEDVWQVLAVDFDKIGDWSSLVPKSVASNNGELAEGAHCTGRVCDLSNKPNGPQAIEDITYFDGKSHTLKFDIIPINSNLPVVKNKVTAKLNEKANGKTEVIWNSDLTLSTVGKVLQPAIKLGVKKGFDQLLEEMKYYLENGEAHPRKIKAVA